MSDEDYSPDTFDWGDGPGGITLDDVAPDIVEHAIKAALDAQEEAFGWRYVRRSEVKEGSGRLFRVKYFVKKESREWFEEQFPGYTFIWDGAIEHHDHPVAHLCTELNELAMVEPLIREGEVWIDLFGNGARDRKYKRKCINLYTKKTPKDYIRYQNPGPNDLEFDMEKLCDPKSVLGKIDRVTCTHAAYYLTMDQIARIVHTSPTRKFSALVHRHRETHGFLNHDEQEYWVTDHGLVEQVNVATGEKYTHPSLEGLFRQGSARAKAGGVAWTISAGGGDTFRIDFVGCPNEVCEVYVPLMLLEPKTREVHTYAGVTVKKFLHWTWMSATTSQGMVMIEDQDLFTKLRRYVAGKQRSPKLKTELMNHARRLTNKADIISIHGGGASNIPVAAIHEYVEVAFYVDVKAELDASISFNRDNVRIVEALNAYYDKGVVPRDITLVTGAACFTAKTFSDAAIRVINALKEANEVSVGEYLSQELPGADLAKLALEFDVDQMVAAPWAF